MASLLICADIFGVTPDLKGWAKNVNKHGDNVLIDAFDSKVDFPDECVAYAKFLECGGVDNFVEKILFNIECHQPSAIIGFSAGAASAYKALSLVRNHENLCTFTGFYPSQIRYFTDLNPNIDCTLYFPNSEPNFSVDQVIDELQQHENVRCQKTKYKHGFMNPKSSGYSSRGHFEFTERLKIK